ncbi:MAG: class I SAM-dependent methyltransferase [Alphaproteobacteria bacterium]|nr:class I SAM-dependent methyltransferase [Alphaproteobacteria bacterium]
MSPPAPPPNYLDLNRAMWDERVPIHIRSALYDVEGFKAGRDPLRPFEIEEMGPVENRELVHLQCHLGIDTLGWARRGARVTGLDFSGPAIEAATRLAAETGIDARFVRGDVLAAPDLLNARYDIVYTGLGALLWLPDLKPWAEVVARLLNPGGQLYLSEFHPLTGVFADADLSVVGSYFHEARSYTEPGSYADPGAATEHNVSWEWQHPLADILQAILGAGLVLDWYAEHDFMLFPRWPSLERTGVDTFRFPDGHPRLPLMLSLRARKPA